MYSNSQRSVVFILAAVVFASSMQFAATSRPATSTPSSLTATMQLANTKLLLGEPLVVTVSLVNGGKDITTGYASDTAFRQHVPIKFVLEQDDKLVLETEGRSSGARVMIPDDKFLAIEEVRKRYLFESGSARKAKKVLCLVENKGKNLSFVPPGRYKVTAHVQLGDEEVVSETQDFSVVELPLQEQKMLEIFTPSLQPLLEGKWGQPTAEMIQLGVQLRESYPHARHRIYLDRWLLSSNQKPDKYRVAADEYLKTFTSTPLGDDVLWEWAGVEHQANNRKEAKILVSKLLKEYPESPYVADARKLVEELNSRP